MDHQSCPNCEGAPARQIFVVGGRPVLQCVPCGLQFARDYPEIETADEGIYSQGYFADGIAQREARKAIFRQLIDELREVTGDSGRLLDVGAGDGALVETAQDMGWEASGSDISSAMVRFMKEERHLNAHYGEIERIDLPAASFHAITLNHVLEHVRNPRATLERVAHLLAPGGVVRVEVPNLAGFSAGGKNFQSRYRLKSNPWKHYDTGHHFWFFTPETLAHTLATAGLTVVALKAPARQWGEIGAAGRLLNRIYRKTLWGAHLVALARRPAGA